jgi:hypothetical protein
MTSLEAVWRTAVTAAELETLILLSSRGCPSVAATNGPLMARRPLRPELAALLGVWPSSQLARCAGGFSRAYVIHSLPVLLPALSACPVPTSPKVIPCISREGSGSPETYH